MTRRYYCYTHRNILVDGPAPELCGPGKDHQKPTCPRCDAVMYVLPLSAAAPEPPRFPRIRRGHPRDYAS